MSDKSDRVQIKNDVFILFHVKHVEQIKKIIYT